MHSSYQSRHKAIANPPQLTLRSGFLGNASRSGHRLPTEDPLTSLGQFFRNSVTKRVLCLDADCAHCGSYLLKTFIAVHVETFVQKHDALLLMARKLHKLVHHGSCEDNVDALSLQELLMPGQVMTALLREKLEEAIRSSVTHMTRDSDGVAWGPLKLATGRTEIYEICGKLLGRYSASVGSQLTAFLATGNLVSSSGLDLQQSAGFTIVAERLNMCRFATYFRAVHRGQFFATMKTTEARKLLPEAWGFLCPVHTPDGALCGLLSHLSKSTCIVFTPSREAAYLPFLVDLLCSIGMRPVMRTQKRATPELRFKTTLPKENLPVCLDGKYIGFSDSQKGVHIAQILRAYKTSGRFVAIVCPTIEIVLVSGPAHELPSCSGMYLFLGQGRLIRPVLSAARRDVEYISPLEQTALQVYCGLESQHRRDVNLDLSSDKLRAYCELDVLSILSNLASLTPFSDYNQSPRNTYQCQMGKQTMGTPTYAYPHRCDTKLFRLLTPQSPLVMTRTYASYSFDEHAQGTNGVVAVVSYTGYDMEDAVILNRSAVQRGFAHGAVYKNYVVDLDNLPARGIEATNGTCLGRLHFTHIAMLNKDDSRFTLSSMNADMNAVARDGLPVVGEKICRGQAFWCARDDSGQTVSGRYKDSEPAYVEGVRLIG